MGVAALPVALAVAGRLGRAAFAAAALPVLQPVMEQAAAATGGGGGGGGAGLDMLSALVSHSEALAGLMDGWDHGLALAGVRTSMLSMCSICEPASAVCASVLSKM